MAARVQRVLKTVDRYEAAAPHGEHRLPRVTIWGATLVTSVAMALLNLATILAMEFLISFKFEVLQTTVNTHGAWAGIGALVGISSGFALVLMNLVFFLVPDAGGSGSPENRGWLNGNASPHGYFTWKNFFGRAVATILSNATGFPVGREGPTVTLGSNLAFLVTKSFAAVHVKQRVIFDHDAEAKVKITDTDQLELAQRVVCAVGGACGMAMIFNSPMGGFLYMFEDMTAYSWPLETTFRSFVALMVCTVLSQFLLSLMGKSVEQFVLYIWAPQERTWIWRDVPPAALMSVVLGVFGVVHTKLCLKVQTARQRFHKRMHKYQPYAKIVESVIYAGLCAFLCGVASLPSRCSDRLDVAVTMVNYTCPDNTFNPVASLLLTTAEGAVRRLFQFNAWGMRHLKGEALSLVVYTTMNIGLTGIPVPSGNFTGTMLIGAMFGRLVGSLLEGLDMEFAQPAVYSMFGAAAMLSSFKRMTFAVVMFIVGASNNFSCLPLVMMCVCVSLGVSRLLSENGYDEEQALRKNVPYLEPKVPQVMENKLARELCEVLPECAILPPLASTEQLQRALQDCNVRIFPVVKLDADGRARTCIGWLPRYRIDKMVGAVSDNGVGNEVAPGPSVDLARFADEVSCMILATARASSFYALFAQAGIRIVSVVEQDGSFAGVITRMGLISETHRLEAEAHMTKRHIGCGSESSDESNDTDSQEEDHSEEDVALHVTQ